MVDNKNNRSVEVTIIGAGLNGLLTAAVLSSEGFSVQIVDKSNDIKADAEQDRRTSALNVGLIELLKNYGLYDEVLQYLCPMNHIYTFDIKGKNILSLEDSEGDLDVGKPVGYIIYNFDIKRILINFLEKKGVAFKTGLKVVDVENDHNDDHIARVCLQDVNNNKNAQTLTKLVISCDGKNSNLPSLLGLKRRVFDYNQDALIFDITHEELHKNIAIEQFCETGPFATLPLPDDGGVSKSGVVWSLHRNLAQYLYKNQDRILPHLQNQLQRLRHFGDISKVEISSKVNIYPLNISFLNKQIVNRVVFIGDSFNAIHPVAGQGFNMAVKDIIRLKSHLIDIKNLGLDIGLYQNIKQLKRQNLYDHLAIASSCDFLVRLFSNKSSFLRDVRDFGIDILEHCDPIKKKLITYATGG